MHTTVLKGCPHCEGPVGFHDEDGCDGCHLIECKACDAYFDYSSGADPHNQCETLEELREACAVAFNKRPK